MTISMAFSQSSPLAVVLAAVLASGGLQGADCNQNGERDEAELASGAAEDCNGNGVPDACEFAPLEFASLEFGPLEFGPGQENLAVGDFPRVSVAADFNGDGLTDLATGNQAAAGGVSTISVLLSREGDGFEPTREFAVGDKLLSMAVMDVDGDGDVDIATAHSTFVLLLENDGRGTLGEAARVVVLAGTTFVTSADVNGDGAPDLVVSNTSENTVSVLANVGGGGFSAAVPFAVGRHPVAVAAGDFDGDGGVDLAAVNRNSRDVSVLLGEGDGLATATSYPAGDSSPSSILAGDLDGDGDEDLAFLTLSRVSLLFNDGAATFVTGVPHTISASAFVAADLDSDGDLDLALGRTNPNVVSLLVNSDRGRFGVAGGIPLDWAPLTLTAGDVDGDGDLDLAAGGKDLPRIVVLLGGERTPRRALVLSATTVATGYRPHAATTGDLDGDGVVDVIAANGHDRTVSVLMSRGDGTTAPPQTYVLEDSERLISVATGDLDADGDVDVVLADVDLDLLRVHLNEGDGRLTTSSLYAADSRPIMVTTADVNGSGTLDLLSANEAANTVTVWLNNGVAGFTGRRELPVGSRPLAVVARDFDGDGDTDVAAVNAVSADVSIVSNRGDGAFSPAANYPVIGNPVYVTAGDFDGDGDTDLATVNASTTQRISILTNLGDGTFELTLNLDTGRPSYSLITVDVDGDGLLDLVTANEEHHSVSLILGGGDGTFVSPFHYAVGKRPRFVVVGDLDRDGHMDLVSANRGGGAGGPGDVTLLIQQARPLFAQDYLGTVCTELEFHNLSAAPDPGAGVDRSVDFLIPTTDAPGLLPPLFANAQRFLFLPELLASVFPGRFRTLGLEEYDRLIGRRRTRQYFAGTIHRLRRAETVAYGFSISVSAADLAEQVQLDEVRRVYETLRLVFHLTPLGYLPDSLSATERAATWPDPGFPVFSRERESRFLRGDTDVNGTVNIADSLLILNYLFLGGAPPGCLKSADVEDGGTVNLVDAIYLLDYVLRRGPSPAVPFAKCGPDPTPDALSCGTQSPCG